MNPRNVPTIILTNYKRPQNMPLIIKWCMESKHTKRIILVDNSEHGLNIQLPNYTPPPQVEIVRNGKNNGAWYRFELSMQLDCNNIMCIDDDIFLTPEQIDKLFEKQMSEPNRAHGVWGQTAKIWYDEVLFTSGLYYQDAEFDVLNRVYCFSSDIAKLGLELLETLGYLGWADIGPIDDIIISQASETKSLCHNLGFLINCPTASSSGIAVWRTNKQFDYARDLIFKDIININQFV